MGSYDEIKGGEFTTNERQREVNGKVKSGGNGEENYEAQNGAEKPKEGKKRRTEEKNEKRKVDVCVFFL